MRNVLFRRYPSASFHACWFHFTQACKKKAAKIDGFVRKIRSCEISKSIYWRSMCIPLLPADEIQNAYLNLKAESAGCEVFELYFDYFHSQWLENVCLHLCVFYL